MADRSVSVPMTLSDLTRVSRYGIVTVEYLNVLGTKLLQNTNRKPYLTYRMGPCLVTLTEL